MDVILFEKLDIDWTKLQRLLQWVHEPGGRLPKVKCRFRQASEICLDFEIEENGQHPTGKDLVAIARDACFKERNSAVLACLHCNIRQPSHTTNVCVPLIAVVAAETSRAGVLLDSGESKDDAFCKLREALTTEKMC